MPISHIRAPGFGSQMLLLTPDSYQCGQRSNPVPTNHVGDQARATVCQLRPSPAPVLSIQETHAFTYSYSLHKCI